MMTTIVLSIYGFLIGWILAATNKLHRKIREVEEDISYRYTLLGRNDRGTLKDCYLIIKGLNSKIKILNEKLSSQEQAMLAIASKIDELEGKN